MATPLPPTAGIQVPSAFVAGLVGADKTEQVEFTEQVLEALGKISQDLVPRLFAHPLADAITQGVSAFPKLLADYRASEDETERAALVDAVAEIIDREHATQEVLVALNKIVSGSKSSAVVSIACRAIALAGDEGFLEQQKNFLASDSLSAVRVSARLLGFGKYDPAVEVLLLLLRPDNMAVADAVLEALGDIGSPVALPKLHGMLSDLVMVEHVIEAVGKIGDTTSVIRLLPLLMEGSTGQREKAAHALARIARANDGWLGDEALTKATLTALERTIDADKSTLARFHCIIAYSLLGGRLDPARIKQALGATLSKKEMDSLSGFFSTRPDAADDPRGPKPPKKRARKPV